MIHYECGLGLGMQILIGGGVDMNLNCGYFGGSCISRTCWIYCWIMDRVNIRRGFWGSALQAFVDTGHGKVVHLLLDHGGTDVNTSAKSRHKSL